MYSSSSELNYSSFPQVMIKNHPVFAVLVVSQSYHVTVPDDSVILGNDVIVKCNIPSFMADFLSVTGWVNSEGLNLSENGKH